MRKIILAALATFSLVALANPLLAHSAGADKTTGDIHVSGPWARGMLPGQPTGGAYLSIRNDADEADRLVSVTSPAAEKVEIHTMKMEDDVMVMRPLEGGLEIPAGESVALKPGGLHLMFMQVTEPFSNGGEVPITLEFENAGTVDLTLPVLSASTGRSSH